MNVIIKNLLFLLVLAGASIGLIYFLSDWLAIGLRVGPLVATISWLIFLLFDNVIFKKKSLVFFILWLLLTLLAIYLFYYLVIVPDSHKL